MVVDLHIKSEVHVGMYGVEVLYFVLGVSNLRQPFSQHPHFTVFLLNPTVGIFFADKNSRDALYIK